MDFINYQAESFKLAELRAKTDRQLITLIGSSIERGLALAGLLADRKSRNGWACAKAEAAYGEASLLLPWVYDATKLERRRLELKLALLREMLDELGAQPGGRVRTACS